MVYLLIVQVSLYVALAALVLNRQLRSPLHIILGLFATMTALATSGYLVLGTTPDEHVAQVAATIVVLSSSAAYVALLPLTLLNLYFESSFEVHRRRLTLLAITAFPVFAFVILMLLQIRTHSLVTPIGPHTWVPWVLVLAYETPSIAIAGVFGSQIPSILVIAAALRDRRLTLWRGAVPLTLVNTISVLVPLLAPLVGGPALISVAALGYVPPVALYVLLLIRATRLAPLDRLVNSAFPRYNEGLAVLDAMDRLVWHNAEFQRWLPWSPSNFAPQPIADVLHGTLLLTPVQQLLETSKSEADCVWTEKGQEVALKLELQPLNQVQHMPGAKLLIVRDVTHTRVMANLYTQRNELLAFSAISADIASSLDLEQVVTRALQQTQVIVRADVVVVYLLDEDDPTQLVRSGQIMRNRQQHPVSHAPATLPVSGTQAGAVVQSAEPVFIEQVDADTPFGQRMTALGLDAGAVVPLLARNRVIGVLQLGMYQPREFDPVAVALIESVGQQLGVAIDNARLHDAERRQRHVAEVLGAIAGILTTRSAGDQLHELLSQLQHLIAYDRASILLVREPGQLGIAAYIGFVDPPSDEALSKVRIAIDDFRYLQRLFAQRQPQLVRNTECDPNWKPGDFTFGSWIGAPLVIHDEVLGCLSLGHSSPDTFDSSDLQLAATFADQAVIAVENARLFEAEQRRRHHAEFLYRASHNLNSSSDLDGALYTALTHLAEVVEFDCARIGLLDDERKAWHTRVSYPEDHPPQHGKALPLDQYPLVMRLVNAGHMLHVPETRDEPQWVPDPPHEREIRTWIGVPLIARDQLIGLLNIYSFVPHSFTSDHVDTVRVFANQAAVVLDNFRLLDEASRRNRTLGALNTVLAASNEALAAREDVLQVSLARVLDVLDSPGGAIHQLDDNGHWLRLRAAVGLPGDLHARLKRVPVEGPSNTLSLTPRIPEDATGLHDGAGFLSIPLTASGQTIGLLSMLGAEAQPHDEDLQTLLASIGQQLSVVMDNAILFEATTRRASLSTDLNRLSLALSAQLDRDTVLNLLCEESLGVFDVQGAYVWLVNERELIGTAASGPGADDFIGQCIPLSASHLLPMRVLDQWLPLHAHDLATNSTNLPDGFVELTGAKSTLAVPLLKAEIPLGVLMLVKTNSTHGFEGWPLDQLGTLGVQAALAIQNATLFSELRRRLDQLRLVNEASRYATALLSLKPLLEGMSHKIAQMLNYDLISLLEVTPGAMKIHTIFYHDLPLPDAQAQPLRDDLLELAGRAAQQAAPLQEDAAYVLPESGHAGGNKRCLSALAIPMIIADEVTGVLIVARHAPSRITTEDMDVLNPLAAQLAISLSNARLYQKVRQQTAALEARVAQRTEEIRREQERTEAILRSVADAVIVVDLDARVVLTNPVARELFDKHDLEINLGPRVGEMVAPILNSEHDHHNDLTDIIDTGPITLQAKAAPVVEGDQLLGAVVVLRDITRLRELDRMKDMFVSNVSHELRTPLANLKLYLSLLEQGHPERREKYREVMRREVSRLERLISDLLQISRLKNEHQGERQTSREPLQIDAMIDHIIDSNLALAQSRQITLQHVRRSGTLPTCHGNEDQIFRAITNLVSNALRYTPENGTVTVYSQVSNSSEQTKPEWVIIEVVDTGIGIPKSEMHAIFDRFYRGSNVSPTISGTGLGLAIVNEIVDLHGGTIDVMSEEGQGSTFRITLPTQRDP